MSASSDQATNDTRSNEGTTRAIVAGLNRDANKGQGSDSKKAAANHQEQQKTEKTEPRNHGDREERNVGNNKMELKQSEYDFAREIKRLVEATPHVQNLMMDFDYVCYAIAAANETLEQVLARIYTMQCFREQYRIQDTPEEGIDLIFQRMGTLQPYMLLEIDYIERNQSSFCVYDLAAHNPARIKTDHDLRVFLGGHYYIWHCQFTEFRSLRVGTTVLIECMDSNMDNFDFTLVRKLVHELIKCYPRGENAICFLHSTLVPSLMYNVMKDYLPDKTKNAYHLDYVIEGLEDQRIDRMYKQPTPEAAQARLIVKIRQYLEERYKNRANFSLDNASIVPDEDIFYPSPITNHS